MTEEDITRLIEHKAVPQPTNSLQLTETHISWVLLADRHVYKIKKPLEFSFLNFSTLSKRKFFCRREVALNRKLAPGMYLGVLEVRSQKGRPVIGATDGNIIDYAVFMNRMDESRQLDTLLEHGAVHKESIQQLADRIAAFHQSARVVSQEETWEELFEEFRDLESVLGFLENHFGEETAGLLKDCIARTGHFLKSISDRIAERNQQGFVIYGHGDLHCRNIFMTDPPLIFDCIEFNDAFRKLDVLSEIGFLCMDLERYGREDLAAVFCERYFSLNPCMITDTDKALFRFYKLYRANVRLKVHALQALEQEGDAVRQELGRIRSYLDILVKYYREW